MTECKKLNPFDEAPTIISLKHQKELVLTNYNRTDGSVVDLSCNAPYKLIGQKTVTCKSGLWNFDTKPYCSVDSPDEEGMTEETKVLVGVLVGVAAVVILVLLCIVCSIRSTSKSAKAGKANSKKNNHSTSSQTSASSVNSDTNSNGMTSVERNECICTTLRNNKGYYLDELSYVPPPYVSSHPGYSNGRGNSSVPPTSYHAYDEPSYFNQDREYPHRQRSSSVDVIRIRPMEPREMKTRSVTGSIRGTGDMYYIYRGDPNRHKRDNTEYYNTDSIYRGYSSKQSEDNKPKSTDRNKKFYGEWPSRNAMKEMEEFNRKAIFHGRDPFLWRPVDTNWGFHLNKHDP